MDCDSLSHLIGYYCYPMNEDGSIVFIRTLRTFDDGDDIPAYAELGPDYGRFF